ncbi:hypothetical protein RJ640_018793 [Escallonia rubra]|uniref:SHSP domain-containing protein n=1 Tax=Escallonia rubra TaxID=112253 RepID=A0AA88UTN3_9ASTE|nr:hypothetical protein RJ640_018793 [Escallonia rubra]
MDFRYVDYDEQVVEEIHEMLEFGDESDNERPPRPSRAFIRDRKAMKATPADVLEYPNAYHFVVDMPGVKRDQIKMELENDNVLVVSGKRKREKEKGKHEKEGVKYLRLGRRLGKLLKKFVLPENAEKEAISANYQDGVLTVVVEKQRPPEPKRPRTIEVKIRASTLASDATSFVWTGERPRVSQILILRPP